MSLPWLNNFKFEQVRENTIAVKDLEQQSIPITSNVAALVVAIPNLQPAINDYRM